MVRSPACPSLAGTVLALCACLLLCACQGSGRSADGSGVTTSRVLAVSREYMPPQGGQTIHPPQRMGDARALWKPLTAAEKKRFVAQGPLPPSAGMTPPGGVKTWLPDAEQDVMQSYMYRLTTTHAGVTRRALERAERYMPDILGILAAKGLPKELACLPMVESAFEPRAVSHAGAAGLWQLMPGTARRFGLRVDKGVDERFDPLKATEAAASYLAWLYGYFNDWPLAIAAYNCGEGAMDRHLRLCNVGSFSELSAGSQTLPEETRRFVPQFVAAVSVMSRSAELGLSGSNALPGGFVRTFAITGSSRSVPAPSRTIDGEGPLPALQTARQPANTAKSSPVPVRSMKRIQ